MVTMVPPLLILGLWIPYHRGRIKSDLKLTVRHRFGDGGRLCFPNLTATSAISNVLRTKPCLSSHDWYDLCAPPLEIGWAFVTALTNSIQN